jgi:hypothetical protein
VECDLLDAEDGERVLRRSRSLYRRGGVRERERDEDLDLEYTLPRGYGEME